MKKYLKQVILLLSLLLLTACNKKANNVPEFYITSNGNEIKAITELNNQEYETQNAFVQLLSTEDKESVLDRTKDDRIEFQVKGVKDGTITVFDYVLTENGYEKYKTDPIERSVEVTVEDTNTIYSFSIDDNYASYLSSNTEDYKEGNFIRGYKIHYSQDNSEYICSFVIRIKNS